LDEERKTILETGKNVRIHWVVDGDDKRRKMVVLEKELIQEKIRVMWCRQDNRCRKVYTIPQSLQLLSGELNLSKYINFSSPRQLELPGQLFSASFSSHTPH